MKSFRRLSSTESDTLKTITDYLEVLQAQGKLLYIRHNPISPTAKEAGKVIWRKIRESQLGAADLIVFRRRVFTGLYFADYCEVFCIEVKSPTGKLSKAQDHWAEKAVAQGCRYIVARSLEDVTSNLK